MHMRLKKVTVLGIFGLLVVLLFSPGTCLRIYAVWDRYRLRQVRNTLLRKTDHKKLLTACRQVLDANRLEFGRMYDRGSVSWGADVGHLPEPLAALDPDRIGTDDRGGGAFLVVEVAAMRGFSDLIGVFAYPAGYVPPPRVSQGDRELLEGLWYIDTGYRSPEVSDYVEELLTARK